MEKLEALVSQSKSEDFNNFMETPEARLNRVVNSWDGIAQIRLNIDPLIWQDPSRGSIVVSLIQEAVANSVRSGRANRVDVVSEYSKDSIFVTITDNGSAQLTTERRGIGSQWIDRIAISDWKLEETDKGRVLRVEI
jgi:signal transduction histidine kinase